MKKHYDFDLVTTKGGDKGESSYYSGERRVKYDIVFETVGDLDELNSYLGVLRNNSLFVGGYPFPLIQQKIIDLSAMIATDPSSELYSESVFEKDVEFIEKQQSKIINKANIPTRFILPGEVSSNTAHLDFARTICRRCERRVVELIREKERFDLTIGQNYLNRLSDYLFIIARYEDTEIQKPVQMMDIFRLNKRK